MNPSILVVSLLIFAFGGSVAFAQTDVSTFSEVNELAFMQGTWVGEGWMMGRQRQRMPFQQTEVIQPKVSEQALMIDGLGYALDSTGQVTDRVIHDAFGVISLNPETGAVTMLSFSEANGRMECAFHRLDEKKLYWEFKDPRSGGTIRFTEDFSTEGEWKEIGEISMDGERWFQFFEMNLKRESEVRD